MRISRPRTAFIVLVLTALACNASVLTQAPPAPEVVYVVITETGGPALPPVAPPLETVAPAAPASTLTPTISHVLLPAPSTVAGSLLYDVDSKGTAPEHRAPYGDSYKLNRFERPFTQTLMDYLIDVDILYFSLQSDPTWYYLEVELVGKNPQTGALSADYAVEFDLDRDGHGDVLVWATPPFGSAWTTDRVRVFTDSNNDTGGPRPEHTDAPFNGNGYDQLIFSSGVGTDADLAWARIDPQSSTTIQFAVKRTLLGNTFMWGAYADSALKDPARFNYNDRFTETEAGSPETSESTYYPIKAIYGVDNTCRAAFGFKPTGYEPLICPPNTPIVTPRPGTTPQSCQWDTASCSALGPGWYFDAPSCSCYYFG